MEIESAREGGKERVSAGTRWGGRGRESECERRRERERLRGEGRRKLEEGGRGTTVRREMVRTSCEIKAER